MKAEYDFSKAEKGKFYNPEAKFNFPVYLDPDVGDYLHIQQLVNEWLRANIKLINTVH